MTAQAREREILEPIQADLEEQGYEVYRQPSTNLLPHFMRKYSYVPDLIALKKPTNIAVEVISSDNSQTTILRRAALMKAFEGQKDWELRIYATTASGPELLSSVSDTLLAEQLQTAQTLAKEGYLQATLLLAWSVLEASARLISPTRFSRPQSATQLIEALANAGDLSPSEADVLRELGKLRNRVAHGKLDEPIEAKVLNSFFSVLASLVDRASKSTTNPKH